MPEVSVPYAHSWQEMRKGIDQQGPYYTVAYYFTDWTLSDNVANQLRGYTSRAGTTTIRVPPHQHPLSPNLFCDDVQIEGCGNAILNALGYPSYDAGFLAHATYRSGTWLPLATADPNNDSQLDPLAPPILWCTQEIDYEDEVYVLEKGNEYIWDFDSLTSKIPVKVTLGVTTISLTYYQLPYLPAPQIRSLRNKVNSVAVLGVPIGQLWFKGAKTNRELNTDGTISQTVQLVFKERDKPWNQYLRPSGLWDYLSLDGTSATRVLGAADLTPLLAL